MEQPIRLKPVMYKSKFSRANHNNTQQMFLLKALKITQDPKKLREMMGVKTVAEVYRTLDKLAMRKEYHSALSDAGISFDYIVGGIKGIADEGFKDSDKLNAFKTLLKSVGMDDYKESATAATGTWEEALLEKIEEEKKTGVKQLAAPPVYEVKQPVIPDSAKKKQDEEEEMTSSIYDSK